MKIACYPGSFDPFTEGHLNVALRAKELFDKIIILVANNPDKAHTYLFNVDERVMMIKEVLKDYEGFEVTYTSGLTIQKAKELQATTLIRGLRAITDYEKECQLHEINEYLDPNIDMLYFMAKKDHSFISSSTIKELFFQGVDISSLVPQPVLKRMIEKKNR